MNFECQGPYDFTGTLLVTGHVYIMHEHWTADVQERSPSGNCGRCAVHCAGPNAAVAHPRQQRIISTRRNVYYMITVDSILLIALGFLILDRL